MSNIVENYLKTSIKDSSIKETELTPIVKSHKESFFTMNADFDYKKEITKTLSDNNCNP